jgi:hypothetical protein
MIVRTRPIGLRHRNFLCETAAFQAYAFHYIIFVLFCSRPEYFLWAINRVTPPPMRQLLPTLVLACAALSSQAQTEPRTTYFSGGSEFAFSAPILDVNGNDQGAIVRFAPVVNVQRYVNKDMSNRFGLFLGLSVGNVGFIYDVPESSYRYKFRSYNVGLPVGFKIGTMNEGLFFAGYSFEWPFNYKEKEFLNETKEDKIVVWASKRTEPFHQAVMAGFQLKNGSTLKVKYYFSNFHNQDFVESVNGVNTKPYEGFNANVIQLSLGFALFTDETIVYKF